MEYKIPFVGDPSVGKTSIICRYSQDKFSDDIQPTVGASNFHFTVEHENADITMNIWDTAGQERFRSLVPLYTRGAALVVMVFDITDSNTFIGIDTWYKKLREEFLLKCPIVLVANKMDLDQMVSISETKSWGQKHDVPCFFTSAATGQGITQLFDGIAEIVSQQSRLEEVNQGSTPMDLENNKNQKRKLCC